MYGIDTTAPLGWNVIYNIATIHLMKWMYDMERISTSIKQLCRPVIFSEEFGNIQNATYEYSDQRMAQCGLCFMG